ncbi:hypothetical protein [Trinickia fusca]|uniref:AAA+ ATPase domain-containing protein n=1 Tax=Trinickia fusca TaxID=2419777 RepID=A0A494X5F0_9BURK|nr:hypothetical protein [Trinickia fusca]RKP43456.1 hypothetical protein D7S89_25885 [Trinickia fusca]
MKDFTPWAKRFLDLDDRTIATRTKFLPEPVCLLDSMSAGTAAETLLSALETIFIATPSGIRVIRRIVDVAGAYSRAAFPEVDARAFMSQLYHFDESVKLAPRPAICLTGLAGSGKSALLKALLRLLPDTECDVLGHPLPLRSFLYLAVKEHDTEAAIFNSLRESTARWGDPAHTAHTLPSSGAARSKRVGSVSAVMPFAQRGVFRDGVSAILLDELQFLAQSGATTRIAKTLLLHTYLGPPLLYSANYDMVHGLAKRAQQYRDRLLSNPLVMLPDCLECADELAGWVAYLEEVLRVANGALKFDPRRDAELLHRYSFALRRKLLLLFSIAYGHARESGKSCADRCDFDWAYRSTLYQIHRADVEELASMEVGATSGRKDLVCPFDVESNVKEARQRFYQARLMKDVAQQVVVAALSPPEAKAYAAAGGTVGNVGTAASRRSNGPRVKKPVSAKSLSEGRQRFRSGS